MDDEVAGTDGADDNNQDEQSQEVYDWSAFYDEEGRIYYYNSATGESSWDPPEQFNPPPEQDQPTTNNDDENDNIEDTNVKEEQDDQQQGHEAEPSEAADTSSSEQWVMYQDDEGRDYYYNTVTGETQWDKPEGFDPPPTEEAAPEAEGGTPPSSPVMPSSPVESVDEAEPMDGVKEEPAEEPPEPEEEPVEEIDPAVKRVMEANEALNKPDAILEPGCMGHVTEVVTSEGGPQKAIQALIESFHGQTAICGLLGRWLADLKSQSNTSDARAQEVAFVDASNDIRQMAQDVVNRVARERYTKTGGDSILNLSRSEAAFLEDMMDSGRWRKLLIDLSASNKDSALLMYCLQAISKRGHHREIARRINQSDHFAVFNAMLASELVVVGKIAVSACFDSDTTIGLAELVGDLRRTCTSTAYTYLYAIEVLRHLVSHAKQQVLASGATTGSRFYRAIRKWECLNEDLEGTMVDPTSASGSSPLFRKRRLDVAMTVSELHQRQRRRRDPTVRHVVSAIGGSEDRDGPLETAVLNFIRRFSLGTQINDQILDAMLPSGLGGDNTNKIGRLLVAHPLSIKALLGYLFKPGSQRIASVVTKNKCARLLALAVMAAESESIREYSDLLPQDITSEVEEVSLSRMISEGSQLCERVENMVSFIVTAEPLTTKGAETSPGEQLCALAVKCSPVAQGVSLWARQMTQGAEFVTQASYPSISPSILSITRIIAMKHPFTRLDALDLALGFLSHSNSDVSYKKMTEIKEQSLRLLLCLIVSGEAPAVLSRFTAHIQHPANAGMDSSLVRYFVTGLLEAVRPPFSVPFLRSVAALLNAPKCAEAIKSQYFGNENRQHLTTMIQHLKDMKSTSRTLTKEDTSLVSSLLSSY